MKAEPIIRMKKNIFMGLGQKVLFSHFHHGPVLIPVCPGHFNGAFHLGAVALQCNIVKICGPPCFCCSEKSHTHRRSFRGFYFFHFFLLLINSFNFNALSKFPSTFSFCTVNAKTGSSFPSTISVNVFAVAVNMASLS